MLGSADEPTARAEAVERLTRAYAEVVAEIEATADPQASFDSATQLATLLRQLAEDSADVRARAVARIWESEKMSLASLALRIGVSKARADQLMRAARTKPEEDS